MPKESQFVFFEIHLVLSFFAYMCNIQQFKQNVILVKSFYAYQSQQLQCSSPKMIDFF
jgi:hypothetical protein